MVASISTRFHFPVPKSVGLRSRLRVEGSRPSPNVSGMMTMSFSPALTRSAIGLLHPDVEIHAGLHGRPPDIRDTRHTGTVEHIPGGRGTENRTDHRVFGIAARHAALNRATQYGVITMRNAVHVNDGLWRPDTRHIAGEFRVRAFHHIGLRIKPKPALDDDLGGRRNHEVIGFAFHEFDGLAPNGAHDIVFA